MKAAAVRSPNTASHGLGGDHLIDVSPHSDAVYFLVLRLASYNKSGCGGSIYSSTYVRRTPKGRVNTSLVPGCLSHYATTL